MRATRLRVDQSIFLTTGATLGVVLVVAWLLYGLAHWRHTRKSLEHRALSSAILAAHQAGPLLQRRIDDPLHSWARALKSIPSVRLVAVHDKNGELRSIETSSPALAKRAVWSDDVMAGLYKPATWHLTDKDGMEVCGAMVPIFMPRDRAPAGQLTMAFEVVSPTFPAVSPWWGFFIPLTAVALLAWRYANRRLYRQVVEPFSRLGRRARRGGGELPVDRDDQLGQLAKVFAKLHEQIDHWREEAARLEVSLGKKLENQTRDHMRELRKAAREAEIDPLTGLNNRRVIENHLEQVVYEHLSQGLDMAVAMIDVDNFKAFNDALGHPAGDELLGFVGQLLSKSIREDDLAVRLGGDEFGLILPMTSAERAGQMIHRIIALFGQAAKTLPSVGEPPSLSAGVAGLRQTKATSGKNLLRAADRALYRAKHTGKSRVIVAGKRAPVATAG